MEITRTFNTYEAARKFYGHMIVLEQIDTICDGYVYIAYSDLPNDSTEENILIKFA